VNCHRDFLNQTLIFVVLRGFGKSQNESPSRGTRSTHLVLRAFCNLRLFSFAALGALQCLAVCCSVLQCVTGNGGQFLWTLEEACCSCCSVLQCLAVCSSVSQSAALCCSVLHCAAACCSVLQSAAVCCRVLQHAAGCCSVLRGIAVCCSVTGDVGRLFLDV